MLSKYLLNKVIGYINHLPNLKKIYNINDKIYQKFMIGCMRVPNSDTEYECGKCYYIYCKDCYMLVCKSGACPNCIAIIN